MICRSKEDPVQVQRLANRPTMKTLSTSIAIVRGACQRIQTIDTTDADLESTNLHPTPDLVLGNSCFSSIDLCEHMTENYIGVVKTNHSRYPKQFLQSKMQTWWPAGSHLLLRTVFNKGRRSQKVIFALGYKYWCSTSFLLKGLAILSAGRTIHTKRNGRMSVSIHLPEKSIIHTFHLYFSSYNIIDVLNQSHQQSELALEKHWITFSGFFCIITSLFGVTVVDA